MIQKLESKDWYYNKSIKIPHEWNIKSFGEVVTKLENGYSYKENTELNSTNGLPITRIETIANGFINPKKVGYIKKTNQKRCKTMLQDDILFSHINSLKHVGKIAIYENNPPVLIHGMNLLRIIANHKIFAKYLFYFLQFNPTRDRIRTISQQAVNQVSINTSDLKSLLKIILPTINEQKKIALILSNMDESITSTQKVIDQITILKQGLMQKLLTKGLNHEKFKKVNWHFNQKLEIPDNWKLLPIKEISKINPQSINQNYAYDKIKYLDIGSINDFKIMKHSLFLTSNRPSRAQRIIQKDDILISTVRPYLQSFALVENTESNMVCSTGFTVLRLNDPTLTNFLFNVIKSTFFKNYVIRMMEGIAYSAITSEYVENYLIPIPTDNDELQIISKIFVNVDAQVQAQIKYKEKLEILKKSLMQKLLTGQIRVPLS